MGTTVHHLFLLSAAVATAGLLGLGADELTSGSSPLRLEAGVSLGILLRFGLTWWPVVFIGLASLAPFQVAPIDTSITWAIIGTGQALATAAILRHLATTDARFDLGRRGSTAARLGLPLAPARLAAGIGLLAGISALGATLNTVALEASGFLDPHSRLAFTGSWWIGDVAGSLLAAPIFWWLIADVEVDDHPRLTYERLGLAAAAVACAWVAHSALGGGLAAALPLPIAVLAGVRLGFGGASLVLLFTGLAAAGALTAHAVRLNSLSSLLGESVALSAVGLAGLAAASLRRRPTPTREPAPESPPIELDPTARRTSPMADVAARPADRPDVLVAEHVRMANAAPIPTGCNAIDVDAIVREMKDELVEILGSEERLTLGTAAGTVSSTLDELRLRAILAALTRAAVAGAAPGTAIAIRTDLVAADDGAALELEACEEPGGHAEFDDRSWLEQAEEPADVDLSTVHSMVEMVGGRVHVEYSRVGFGTSYIARVPIVIEDEPARSPKPLSIDAPADPPAPAMLSELPQAIPAEPATRESTVDQPTAPEAMPVSPVGAGPPGWAPRGRRRSARGPTSGTHRAGARARTDRSRAEVQA